MCFTILFDHYLILHCSLSWSLTSYPGHCRLLLLTPMPAVFQAEVDSMRVEVNNHRGEGLLNNPSRSNTIGATRPAPFFFVNAFSSAQRRNYMQFEATTKISVPTLVQVCTYVRDTSTSNIMLISNSRIRANAILQGRINCTQ